MQHQLVIIEGPDAGKTFPLADGQSLTVGRGQASDVRLNDPRVSRIHVRLQVDQGTVVVQDAGSSSGTLVNGGPIEQHTLRPGDVIQIGDTKLRYQFEGTRDASTLVGVRQKFLASLNRLTASRRRARWAWVDRSAP